MLAVQHVKMLASGIIYLLYLKLCNTTPLHPASTQPQSVTSSPLWHEALHPATALAFEKSKMPSQRKARTIQCTRLEADSLPSWLEKNITLLTHPLMALRELHPMMALRELHPMMALRELHPMMALRELHPMMAPRELHPMMALRELHPMMALRELGHAIAGGCRGKTPNSLLLNTNLYSSLRTTMAVSLCVRPWTVVEALVCSCWCLHMRFS